MTGQFLLTTALATVLAGAALAQSATETDSGQTTTGTGQTATGTGETTGRGTEGTGTEGTATGTEGAGGTGTTGTDQTGTGGDEAGVVAPATDGKATGAAADWPVAVTAVFFTDTGMSTLRSADEIRAQWATLAPVDQETVRRDCATMRADAASTGGAALGGVSNTTDTGTAATGTSATGTATEGISGPGSDVDVTETEGGATGRFLSGGGNVDQGDDGFIGDSEDADATATGTDTATDAGDQGPSAAGDTSATATTGTYTGTIATTGDGTGGDATISEDSAMDSPAPGSMGQMSQADLMQICALVNTL